MNLPTGWTRGRLGEKCSIEIGGTPSRNAPDYWDTSKETPNLWVSIRDLNQRVISQTSERISDLGVKHSNVKLQAEGTILLSFKLTIGRVAIAGCPLYTNEAIAGLQSSKITHEYLYHGLQQWDLLQGVDQAIKGATLNKEKLKKIEFDFPQDPSEQKRIGQILSTVDQAIEQTEALIAKHQRIKTGSMLDLLTRGIDEHGNLRSEKTHKFKNSALGKIPVEWEVKRIADFLADVDPPMRSGPFGSALLKDELVESGVPLLGIDNVFAEQFVNSYTRFVHPRKAETLRRYRVRPRDLMITIMGTVGRCCVVPDDIGTALSSKHTWTISLNQRVYSPYLACLQINYAPWVLSHFAKDEQGGIMSAIKSDTLRSTLLPVPPFKEMITIEEILKAISAEIKLESALLHKLNSLKTALMQDLLTGKKRVTALLASEPKREKMYA
jgi:type I restriction enzyme, S subunit